MHARPWSCRKTPNFIERDLWPPLRLKMQNVTVNEPNNVLLLYCSSILFILYIILLSYYQKKMVEFFCHTV